MIQIGKHEVGSFVNPIALLNNCHRRIERFLYILITVKRQAQGRVLTQQQREALGKAIKYFREAAPKHTRDEEESLLPKMMEHSSMLNSLMRERLRELETDHFRADRLHQDADSLCQEWLDQGFLESNKLSVLTALLSELSRFYHFHIRFEDEEVFPMAAEILTATELIQLGEEMAERRK